MLRLTLMSCAAIYAALVIYSVPVPQSDAAGPEVTRAAPALDATTVARAASVERLTTHDGRVLTIATVINPVAMDDGRAEVYLVSTLGEEAVTTSASASVAPPDLPLVQVTGTSVNLRAGPSTDNAVLDALTRGEQVELIAALGNGWAQIRTVETGVEGYMADRFLSPVN